MVLAMGAGLEGYWLNMGMKHKMYFYVKNKSGNSIV
jgi:hypothetical protein